MAMEQVSHLLRRGIIDLGTRSFVISVEEAKRKYGLAEVIKLSGNTNPLGPSPKAIESIKLAAERINLYPDPTALELRSVIAKEYGVGIDQVLQGNGSSELINWIGEVFINEGDECIAPQGAFRPYQEISHIMGGKNIVSPLKEYRIDLEDMARKVSAKTKLIIIVNPNNPTGNIVKHKDVEAFLDKIGKDIIVVFDEAYGEYVEDKEYPQTVQFIERGYNVIVLRTLSKAYGLAGSRIGYGISTPEIIRYMNAVRPIFNVNMFAQIAAIEAFKDSDHLKKCVKLVWDEKKYYYDELNKIGLFFIPTSSNFIFVKVGVDDLKLHEAMIRIGVIITPLTPWGFRGSIRVSIGTHYENEKMMACLRKSLEELR